MNKPDYKPKRQGSVYLTPSNAEWRRILRRCKRIDIGFSSPCWIFMGRIDPDGYGEVKYRGAKRFTHRIAYASLRGETPARRDVEHKCHQRACCNPEHLTALPRKEHDAISGALTYVRESPFQYNHNNLVDNCHSGATLDPVPF